MLIYLFTRQISHLRIVILTNMKLIFEEIFIYVKFMVVYCN